MFWIFRSVKLFGLIWPFGSIVFLDQFSMVRRNVGSNFSTSFSVVLLSLPALEGPGRRSPFPVCSLCSTYIEDNRHPVGWILRVVAWRTSIFRRGTELSSLDYLLFLFPITDSFTYLLCKRQQHWEPLPFLSLGEFSELKQHYWRF